MQPMPLKHGVGFTTFDPVPEDMAKGYRHEQVGRHHNYHTTADCWGWPVEYDPNPERMVVDGFSPNLNKELHVGHLRNLALANSLQKMTAKQSNTNFVALLGTVLGVTKAGLGGWEKWLQWTGYSPTVFYDCAMPQDVVKCRQIEDGSPIAYAHVWDGPHGEVIVKRSDGTPLYAFHDLAFADWVGPTHYITGQEQREHFKALGFEDKHYPMGLVLGTDGKKLKSRDGNAMPIKEMIGLVVEQLNDTPEPNKLAWNILVWNMLQPARQRDVKFQVENWVRPESPGMYVTYTYSRVRSALSRSLNKCCMSKYIPSRLPSRLSPYDEITAIDLRLLGVAEYYLYYRQMALDKFDPSPIANFAHTLARELGAAYETEQIQGGRPIFAAAIGHALWRLDACMSDLGLFQLETV